jgi:hypothetical protein
MIYGGRRTTGSSSWSLIIIMLMLFSMVHDFLFFIIGSLLTVPYVVCT